MSARYTLNLKASLQLEVFNNDKLRVLLQHRQTDVNVLNYIRLCLDNPIRKKLVRFLYKKTIWNGSIIDKELFSLINAIFQDMDLDFNTTTHDGRTLLRLACDHNHVDLVRLLLANPNVDVNKADKFDNTPLHVACKKNQVEIVQRLLSDDRTNKLMPNKETLTALDIASNAGYDEISKLFQ